MSSSVCSVKGLTMAGWIFRCNILSFPFIRHKHKNVIEINLASHYSIRSPIIEASCTAWVQHWGETKHWRKIRISWELWEERGAQDTDRPLDALNMMHSWTYTLHFIDAITKCNAMQWASVHFKNSGLQWSALHCILIDGTEVLEQRLEELVVQCRRPIFPSGRLSGGCGGFGNFRPGH